MLRLSSLAATGCKRRLHIHLSTAKGLAKLEDEAATHLSLGVGFVAAYTPNTSSSVWIQPFDCSSNLFGQLGAWHHLRLPTEDAPIRKVACGRSHVVALTTEGKVYATGLNNFGQCGNTPLTSDHEKSLLSRMSGLTEERINQVVCGLDHTLLLADSGKLFSCGWGADGQTGVGRYSNVSSPTRVRLPSDLCFSHVYTCSDSSFAQTDDNQVFGWGNNEYGQLGVSIDDPQVSTPVPLDLSDLDGQLISMATGGAFTAFLTSRGSVYLVGYSIEDPSLSHDRSSGKLLPPHQMSRLRKIHRNTELSTDYMSGLHAGLHYLVGEVSPQQLIVWGRYPDSERVGQETRKKITLDHKVQNIVYGPTSIAAVFSDNFTKPMSFP